MVRRSSSVHESLVRAWRPVHSNAKYYCSFNESGHPSSLGGLIGLVIAGAASMGLAHILNVPFLFDARINMLAFAFSAGIGVLFGYLPAQRAARLDPIEALRHE